MNGHFVNSKYAQPWKLKAFSVLLDFSKSKNCKEFWSPTNMNRRDSEADLDWPTYYWWNKPVLHDNVYETKKWAFIIAFTLIALHRLVPDFFCQYFRIWFRAAKKRKKCTQIRLRACLPISPFTNFSVFLFSSKYLCQFWVTWPNMSNIRLNLTCVMNAVKLQSAVVKLLIWRFFLFSFLVPSISILSDSAKHVEHQSALNLTCVMNAVPSDGGQKWPKMVWYKDGKVSIHNNVSDAGRWKTLGVPVSVVIGGDNLPSSCSNRVNWSAKY